MLKPGKCYTNIHGELKRHRKRSILDQSA